MNQPKVAILMGSDSDFGVMEAAVVILEQFGVAHEVLVSSAHRTPERTLAYAREARQQGIRVIIAGAGAAAHLAGVIASSTTLPVIGVPIDASALNGVDALYATVMMPGGVPVASMAIGKAGATNAALFAVSILAGEDPALVQALADYRETMAAKVQAKSDALQQKIALRGN
jgi:phosphoribosylaminoimidazole carboxylase PurE protein